MCGESDTNTYKGEGTSRGTIIQIKLHCASLNCGTFVVTSDFATSNK